jgi:hypothetical protein
MAVGVMHRGRRTADSCVSLQASRALRRWLLRSIVTLRAPTSWATMRCALTCRCWPRSLRGRPSSGAAVAQQTAPSTIVSFRCPPHLVRQVHQALTPPCQCMEQVAQCETQNPTGAVTRVSNCQHSQYCEHALKRNSAYSVTQPGNCARSQFPPAGARVIDAYVVWKRSHNFKLASAHRHFCGAFANQLICAGCCLCSRSHQAKHFSYIGLLWPYGHVVQMGVQSVGPRVYACTGADMRDAHTALADASATLQVQFSVPTCGQAIPAEEFGDRCEAEAYDAWGLQDAAGPTVCPDPQVLLGQLRYYPALANTVPALQELCSAPPKVLQAPELAPLLHVATPLLSSPWAVRWSLPRRELQQGLAALKSRQLRSA